MSPQLHQSHEQAPTPVTHPVAEVAPLPPTPQASNFFRKVGSFLDKAGNLFTFSPSEELQGEAHVIRIHEDAHRARTGDFPALTKADVAAMPETREKNIATLHLKYRKGNQDDDGLLPHQPHQPYRR